MPARLFRHHQLTQVLHHGALREINDSLRFRVRVVAVVPAHSMGGRTCGDEDVWGWGVGVSKVATVQR